MAALTPRARALKAYEHVAANPLMIQRYNYKALKEGASFVETNLDAIIAARPKPTAAPPDVGNEPARFFVETLLYTPVENVLSVVTYHRPDGLWGHDVFFTDATGQVICAGSPEQPPADHKLTTREDAIKAAICLCAHFGSLTTRPDPATRIASAMIFGQRIPLPGMDERKDIFGTTAALLMKCLVEDLGRDPDDINKDDMMALAANQCLAAIAEIEAATSAQQRFDLSGVASCLVLYLVECGWHAVTLDMLKHYAKAA